MQRFLGQNTGDAWGASSIKGEASQTSPGFPCIGRGRRFCGDASSEIGFTPSVAYQCCTMRWSPGMRCISEQLRAVESDLTAASVLCDDDPDGVFVYIKPEMECSFSSWCVCRVVLHKLAADALSNDDVLTDPACGSIPTCRDNPRIKKTIGKHTAPFNPPASGAATGPTATKSRPLPKASPSKRCQRRG